MTSPRPIPTEILRLQERASRPGLNVWVSANAGSGKTHVLTQRVIRLLLDGVPPSSILCLTFTKAAAANMSLRVFQTLARWTALTDEELARAIVTIGARPTPDLVDQARTLFSRAMETPGGLKIQTIHGFCEAILHRFPFEAGAPSSFEIVDDAMRTALMARARADALADAASDPMLAACLGRLGDLIGRTSGAARSTRSTTRHEAS